LRGRAGFVPAQRVCQLIVTLEDKRNGLAWPVSLASAAILADIAGTWKPHKAIESALADQDRVDADARR
jgi:hypothetical protein